MQNFSFVPQLMFFTQHQTYSGMQVFTPLNFLLVACIFSIPGLTALLETLLAAIPDSSSGIFPYELCTPDSNLLPILPGKFSQAFSNWMETSGEWKCSSHDSDSHSAVLSHPGFCL